MESNGMKRERESDTDGQSWADTMEKDQSSRRSRSRSPIDKHSKNNRSRDSSQNRNSRSRNRSRSPRGKRTRAPTNRRVYVANIPYDCKWTTVKDLFREKVGDVSYVELFEDEGGKFRGCGIVELKEANSVQKAVEVLHRFEYRGRQLVVKEDFDVDRDKTGKPLSRGGRSARDQDRGNNYGSGGGGGGGGSGGGGGGNRQSNNAPQYNTYGLSPQFLDSLGVVGPLTNRIFVANLDYKVTTQKLEDVFKLAGRVVNIELKRDDDGNSKGHGTIEMSHPVEAVQAISMFNGQKFYNRTMSVRMDKKHKDDLEDKRLPEGLQSVGKGLGANGLPLHLSNSTVANLNAASTISPLGGLGVGTSNLGLMTNNVGGGGVPAGASGIAGLGGIGMGLGIGGSADRNIAGGLGNNVGLAGMNQNLGLGAAAGATGLGNHGLMNAGFNAAMSSSAQLASNLGTAGLGSSLSGGIGSGLSLGGGTVGTGGGIGGGGYNDYDRNYDRRDDYNRNAQQSSDTIVVRNGWNDVSFHNSAQIPTPNLDALAASGIVLQSFYAGPLCTSARASLMTGKYASNIGLQHENIMSGQPFALPLTFKTMPQYFKDLNYTTHMIGKWQLGYFNKSYLPKNRGFDDFFGCLNGQLDYYDHTLLSRDKDNTFWGIDLNDGDKVLKNLRGQYLTDLFTDRAIHVIQEHNESQPLFLLLSHVAVHVGNSYMPLQAPPENVGKNYHINDPFRRIFAGMIMKLDDSVGKVFQALENKKLLDNSIIIFFSDNGGVAQLDPYGSFSSNWPLRGGKKSLWEGGIRVPALLWSPLFKLKRPVISYQLMHISDVLPTLYTAAGGNPKELGRIDGMDMWTILKEEKPSLRSEVLFLADAIYSLGAIRIGDYKLIKGSYPEGENGWYGSPADDDLSMEVVDEGVWKNSSIIKDILQMTGRWLIKEPDLWRTHLSVNCSGYVSSNNRECDPVKAPCLFNIVRDPCERVNLAESHPKVVKSMLQRLRVYEQSAVNPLNEPADPQSDPRCYEFTYVSWMDSDRQTTECSNMQ